MGIKTNLDAIKNNIPENVILVAVSKTKPNSDILEAYNSGQRIFGENKVQELALKQEELPKDINWHMIGHLQTNKVKYIAPFVSLIHGVDSIKLLKEINKRAIQNNRIIDCLFQVHIAQESTKFGFGLDTIEEALNKAKNFKNIKIKGLMGMATFSNNTEQITSEFQSLKTIFDKLKSQNISILSIGMSGDYKIAIENGSTMIRVGSAVFGSRD